MYPQSENEPSVTVPARQPPTLSMQIGLYAGLALLLAGLMVLGMKRILEDSLMDKASMLARQIATVSLDAVLMHDYGVLERYSADLSGADGLVYLRIRREDGTILAEASDATNTQPLLKIEKPILLADRVVGDVTVAYERSTIDRAISRFTLVVILAVALLSVLFFFTLRALLKRRLIDPIERLARELHPLHPGRSNLMPPVLGKYTSCNITLSGCVAKYASILARSNRPIAWLGPPRNASVMASAWLPSARWRPVWLIA